MSRRFVIPALILIILFELGFLLYIIFKKAEIPSIPEGKLSNYDVSSTSDFNKDINAFGLVFIQRDKNGPKKEEIENKKIHWINPKNKQYYLFNGYFLSGESAEDNSKLKYYMGISRNNPAYLQSEDFKNLKRSLEGVEKIPVYISPNTDPLVGLGKKSNFVLERSSYTENKTPVKFVRDGYAIFTFTRVDEKGPGYDQIIGKVLNWFTYDYNKKPSYCFLDNSIFESVEVEEDPNGNFVKIKTKFKPGKEYSCIESTSVNIKDQKVPVFIL